MPDPRIKALQGEPCYGTTAHAAAVGRANAAALPDRDLARLARIFQALADPSRLKLVLALGQGEMCVCALASHLGLTDSAVSHQLRRLKDLALVKARREGQMVYYALDDDHVSRLLRMGLEHVKEGER
jgi:DNA-binding transcriptional ArsR family regulator